MLDRTNFHVHVIHNLSKGLYRGSIGENNLGDFLFFPNLLLYFWGVLGVYIIPKWLIKVPGHIAILFG